jgi:hypothetical protein
MLLPTSFANTKAYLAGTDRKFKDFIKAFQELDGRFASMNDRNLKLQFSVISISTSYFIVTFW